MHIEQPVTAYIGLGANLGQAPHTLRSAFEALANSPDVSLIQASSLYESAPVDAPGPIYTNAVVEIHTTLKAQALLDTIQNIEHQFGRERSIRNAPRTLDLDILWFDNQAISEPSLCIPHPRAHQRAFVLMPWLEIAPVGFKLEHDGVTRLLAEWLNTIHGQTCRRL